MPAQWADGQLLGDKWQPPLGVGHAHLVRFAFSLRADGRTKITAAEFCLSLNAGTVFDCFPREQTIEQDRSVTLAFEPSLKLADTVDVSLGKAETTIDIGRVIPVIHTEGIQSARLCWRFAAHAKFPLLGDKLTTAVITLPPGVTTAQARLDLAVTCEDRLGPIRLGMPATDQRKLEWMIGDPR